MKGAAPHIVPLLLEALCKQEEYQDDDTWNMAMAAATCLAKIAQTIEDDVVEIVMPFIQKHIADPDWRRHIASTLARLAHAPRNAISESCASLFVLSLVNHRI